MEDGVKDEGEEGEPVETCEGGREPFVVSGEAAEASGPGGGALDYPALGQEDKTLPGLGQLNHDQADSLLRGLGRGFFSGVTLVSKGHGDFLARHFLHLREPGSDPGALLLVGRRDFQG